MNSVKTAFVSLMLLGVLYGMYQVLNTPPARFNEDGYAVAEAPAIEADDEELDPDQMLAEYGRAREEAATEMMKGADEASTSSSDRLGPPPIMPSGDSAIGPPPSLAPSTPSASSNTASSNTVSPSTASPSSPPPSTPPARNPLVGSLASSGTTSPPPTTPPAPTTPGGGSFAPRANDAIRDPNVSGAGGTAPLSGGFVRNPASGSPASTTPPPTAAVPGNGATVSTNDRRELPSSAASIADAQFAVRLDAAWTRVDELVEKEEFGEALQELSFFYGDRRLNAQQETALHEWLDALAAKVIYSTEPHLEEIYIVRTSDTLAGIANAFGITPELLYNINQEKIPGPMADPTPGTELKVVTGPFRLRIEKQRGRATLFVGGRYAGRFETRELVGVEPGTELLVVERSSEGMAFESPSGPIAALDGTNPLGRHVLKLSDGTYLHEAGLGSDKPTRSIGLSGPHALDLYSILGVGCRIDVID